ncbi:MAG: hypothetical protein KA187_10145 [Arenimonas sp.]|nr:hypothetical protein [Arenimonas sp.]MBP6627757.1 hypothetical protein [Arenimonas sp.]
MRSVPMTLIAASIALSLASKAQAADLPAAPAAPMEAAASAAEAPRPAVAMVAAANPAPIGSATVTVSVKNNAPYFSQMSEGWRTSDRGAGGMMLGTGDIDLSGFPAGDVLITVQLDDLAYGAGYRFSTDGWQAVAIAADPPGAPVAPTPVFGQAHWPAQFQPPAVTADQRSVSWTDLDSDQNVYEYSVAMTGPNGVVVLDPRIKPGGGTAR